jgi:hypothetical protein
LRTASDQIDRGCGEFAAFSGTKKHNADETTPSCNGSIGETH